MPDELKVAIIYDWIDKWGGVERVLLHFNRLFPKAEFFSSYLDIKTAPWANKLKIHTSFIQNLPHFIKRKRLLSLPFYPYAFESFDFSNYDLVISVTSSFAKSVITKPGTLHICYLLTPTRFLWDFSDMYLKKYKIMQPYIKSLKKWDFISAQKPDHIISISKTVRKRCLKHYQRQSTVIYPPFDTQYWTEVKSKIQNSPTSFRQGGTTLGVNKYFLIVSRLEPYKKVDLAVEVFNQLNQQLVILGEGSCEKKLKSVANKNIIFLKKIDDEELGWLYTNAKALIMPQEEDFGYVSLEAQFFGCPVISFCSGGAGETIIENKTGIFFIQQTQIALTDALERFKKKSYNLRCSIIPDGRRNLELFSTKNFDNYFLNFLKKHNT